MSEKTSAKQIQNLLLKKEDDIIKSATLYCAEHGIEFNGKHRILARVMLRRFFCDGVYPIVRDLFDVNIKKYHE